MCVKLSVSLSTACAMCLYVSVSVSFSLFVCVCVFCLSVCSSYWVFLYAASLQALPGVCVHVAPCLFLQVTLGMTVHVVVCPCVSVCETVS